MRRRKAYAFNSKVQRQHRLMEHLPCTNRMPFAHGPVHIHLMDRPMHASSPPQGVSLLDIGAIRAFNTAWSS